MQTIQKNTKPMISRLKNYRLIMIICWTILIAISVFWYIKKEMDFVIEDAKIMSKASFEKDVLYRFWNSMHKGVYVPVTDTTQPNEYLVDEPERDITTPSGIKLTKMNPAYMTRQVHELGKKRFGIFAHITSLKPVNPSNKPDEWEKKALKRFENGEKEIYGVEEVEGKKYLYYMQPLMTEKACLRCHERQGYAVGDVRGGISVAVPIESFLKVAKKNITIMSSIHIVLWIVGLFGIILIIQKLILSEKNRSKFQEDLINNERRYQALFNSALEGVFICDKDGKFMEANNKMLEMTGYNKKDLIAFTFQDIIPKTQRKLANDTISDIIKEGKQKEFVDFEFMRKDGKNIWVEIMLTLLKKENKPYAIQGVARDISLSKEYSGRLEERNIKLELQNQLLFKFSTDIKLQQSSLLNKLQRLTEDTAKMLKIARVSVWFFDNAKSKIICQDLYELASKKHTSGHELLAKEYPAYFNALNKDLILSATNAREDNRTSEFTDGYLKPIGIYSMLDASIRIKGELYGVVCLENTDSIRKWNIEEENFASTIAELIALSIISDQNIKSERGEKESFEKFQSIFENATEGMILVNKSGKILEANQQFYKITELTKADVIDKNTITLAKKLLSVKQIPIILNAISKTLAGKGVKNLEIEYKDKFLEINAHVDFDKFGILGIIRDNTAKKIAEKTIKDHSRKLEKLVYKRTKEIKEKSEGQEESQQALTFLLDDVNDSRLELQRINKKMEDANAELEAFSYSVSHDLKAPLRAIDGFSQILLEDYSATLDDEGTRYLNLVRENTQQMGQLIQDLLNLSRAGRAKLVPVDINAMELVKQVYSEIRGLEPVDRKIELKIGKIPTISGDKVLIRQVLFNLISNAVKFTRTKDETIIEVGCKSKDELNVYFVKDNGVGFSMKYADKLFKVFQRLHFQDEYEGTGVGLALVKRIINRHGGLVKVEARKDKGATFYFALPK